MEKGIRDILQEHYKEMMDTITEPTILAQTISVFTSIDQERINAESRERGPSTGVFELLNRLQKRGPKAFSQLIIALRTNNYYCIADKMEEEALSRNLYRPIRQTSYDATPGHGIVARGPWASPKPAQAERSLSTPVQPTSLNHQESTEEMHPPRASPALLTGINIPKPEDLTPHEEAKSLKPKKKGKETLLKDIPSSLKDQIVSMLNIEDALGKDWKGIAGGLELTAEQQGQIRSCSKISPMEELFNQMLHKGYRVINLIDLLKKIDRQDVIGEISRAGYYSENLEDEATGMQSPTQVTDDSTAKKFDDSTVEEKKRDGVSPTAIPLLSTGEEKKIDADSPTAIPLLPTGEEKKRYGDSPTENVLSPTRSESSSDNSAVKDEKMDEKKEEKEDVRHTTAGLPLPTEVSVFGSDDFTKTDKEKGSSVAWQPSENREVGTGSDKEAGANGYSKTLPSPTQVSEFGSLDGSASKPDKKKEAHLSQEVEDGKKEEEDENEPLTDMTPYREEVFFPDTIHPKAIILTCEKYKNINKLTHLNQNIKKLSRLLEDGNWEQFTLKDLSSSNMKTELELKLHNLSNSDVCFVYLAGHTLQLKGENYFLPIDVELDLAAADIIDRCLNINSLVKQLSEKALMALVIVDGGHHNEETFTCPVALPGLASMIPPSKTVVAFPCQPGYIRPQGEALLYLKALINIIKEKKHIALTDLFDSVREELKDSQSLPVEFSLSSSLLPIYLNTEEDEEGITIREPDGSTPRNALVFCDYSVELHGGKTTVKESAGHLEASLKQLGWKVEMCANLKPEEIKTKIRRSIKGLQDMNVYMLYFIGYASKDKHSIGQESWEFEEHAQKLPIQWLVDMMSEYIVGPKILVVDDHGVHGGHKRLSLVTALPQEVLCCLPNGNRQRGREQKNVDSFTLLFAQNLANSGQYSLKTVITTTARNWKYHDVDSKLFYA